MSWTNPITGQTLLGATPDSDIFTGTDAAGEFADGLDGDDDLSGGGGDDTLQGGAGYDNADGGEGNDSIADGGDGGRFYGQRGNDTIVVSTTGSRPSSATPGISGGEGNDSMVAAGTGINYFGSASSARR
jgi:Ca2+-binding RTX toxin-like protein